MKKNKSGRLIHEGVLFPKAKGKSDKAQFKWRYGVELDSLETDSDFAMAAFKVCNGFYEDGDRIHKHLEMLFKLRTKTHAEMQNNEPENLLNEYKEHYGRLMLDLMADDFPEAMHGLRVRLSDLFIKYPELNTKKNRKHFGLSTD